MLVRGPLSTLRRMMTVFAVIVRPVPGLGAEEVPLLVADIIGLSQLMASVLPKSADGAICASEKSSMNITSP